MMSAEEGFEEDLFFEASEAAEESDAALLLDIDGFEGPLHLLLDLARKQKVDLARVSILDLAEQYLNFIKTAHNLRIELAADYLVMAAWLAYLKSRLILPSEKAETETPEAQELAAMLAFRLERLDAMRRAVGGLQRLPKTGQEILTRGAPEGLRSRTTPLFEAELFDLLKAYGTSRSRSAFKHHRLEKPKVLSMDEARNRLKRAMASAGYDLSEWTAMDSLIDRTDLADDVPQNSVRASSLLAGLELAKEGDIQLRQTSAFQPIYLRTTERDAP
ncbi:segregation/condensation protein A [Algimonas ampicilliniresistens]|uniref:Segregation and condensation protein A n=1 Tax=Algimonas ampicilliniresistens TaxID=1298735 RepID=A0ABQ5V8V9_9PROT|nr:ScpA family protein [Algimonas ampicilliniresistens]GLQ23105.1 segregation/condensation protein A [Algimonas ampicilliniresistens]